MSTLSVTMSGGPEWTARMAGLEAALRDQVPAVVDMAATLAVQDHLDANYVGKPNKLGGTPTGYWTSVRNSVTGEIEGDKVTVKMSGPGLAMKWNGGIIRPSGRISTVTGKPIRFLTVPTAAQSHGKVAAQWGDRLYSRGFAGGRGLSEGDTAAGGGLWLMTGATPSDADPLLYWLVRKVTIRPDKAILPPAEKVAEECAEAVKVLIDNSNSTP